MAVGAIALDGGYELGRSSLKGIKNGFRGIKDSYNTRKERIISERMSQLERITNGDGK